MFRLLSCQGIYYTTLLYIVIRVMSYAQSIRIFPFFIMPNSITAAHSALGVFVATTRAVAEANVTAFIPIGVKK